MLPAGFSAAASGCELVHARGRPYRLTSLVRTSTRSACGSTAVSLPSRRGQRCGCRARSSHAANIKDLGKLSGSPTPVPRTTSSRGAAGCPGHWLPPAADACQCATGCKVHDSKEKAGTHLDDHPIRGSRTTYVDNYFLLWWYFLWQFAQSTTHFRISSRMIVLLKAQSTNRDTLCFLVFGFL